MEKIRLFISQFIASIVVAVLAILFCRHIMICTGLTSRILNLQIHNPVSITLLIGLLAVGILAMKIILWLMRRPMLEEKIDMGIVENIPTDK